MSIQTEVAAIEARIRACGLRLVDVLRLAGVTEQTWRNWRNGAHGPTLGKWRAVEDAFERLREGGAS
jgi:hypothetical protein